MRTKIYLGLTIFLSNKWKKLVETFLIVYGMEKSKVGMDEFRMQNKNCAEQNNKKKRRDSFSKDSHENQLSFTE